MKTNIKHLNIPSIIQQNPTTLRHALVHHSNKDLLKRAVGTVPPGLVNALGKMGVSAQKPSCYLALHKLLLADPSFRHPLSHLNRIDARQIKMIGALGPKFARPNIIAILHGGPIEQFRCVQSEIRPLGCR